MKSIAILLTILILLSSFAFLSVVNAQAEEEKQTTPIKNIIERLKVLDERLREKLEEKREDIGEDSYNRLIADLDEARQLLDEAEEAYNSGDIEEAKQLLKKAGAKYKDIIKELAELLGYENLAKRFHTYLRRCREAIDRLKKITERLKEKGIDTTEVELLISEAEVYLDNAVEAFREHKYAKAVEYCKRAWEKVKEAAELLRSLARELLKQYEDRILDAINRIENFLDKVEEKVVSSNMSEERKEVILNKIEDWRSRLENARKEIDEGKYEEAVIIVKRVLREISITLWRFRKRLG